MICCTLRNRARMPLVVLGMIFVLGTTSCGDDPVGSARFDKIEVHVIPSGSGSGVVTASASTMTIDCQLTSGEVSGVCGDFFDDAGGGGVFTITATPIGGSLFAGWTDLSCTMSAAGSCDLDCGPNDDETTCTLSFDNEAGDVRYDMMPRFDGLSNGVVIQDEFEAVNACDAWTSTVVGTGTFDGTDGCEPAGGNPAGYRTMTHEVTDVGNVVVSHWYSGGSYDPSSRGAIERIDYSESRIITQPAFVGGAVGASFRLEQGGTVYTHTFGSFFDTEWVNLSVSLTPTDFVPAPGPDFSVSGSEIRFGYVRSNSNTTDGAVTTSVHGIDNWRVVIVQVP